MYFMLAGHPPFNGESRKEIIDKILAGNPPYLEEYFGKVSHEAKDLLHKLLCLDPTARISASEALHHPWFKLCSEKPLVSKTDARLCLKKMERFHTQTLLQRAVFAFMASHQITGLEETKLKQVFTLFDADKDGQISKRELIKAYMMLYGDSKKAKKAAQNIFDNIDLNGNCAIDYNGIFLIIIYIILEFLAANFEIQKALTEAKLKTAFDFYDKVYISNSIFIRMEMDR